MEGTFSSRVWELAISIPEGRVTTYGALAKAAGGTLMASRSITSILSKAPNNKQSPTTALSMLMAKSGLVEKTKRNEENSTNVKVSK